MYNLIVFYLSLFASFEYLFSRWDGVVHLFRSSLTVKQSDARNVTKVFLWGLKTEASGKRTEYGADCVNYTTKAIFYAVNS